MIIDRIESEAEAFRDRHSRYLTALKGVVAEALSDPRWGSQRDMMQLRKQTRAVTQGHLRDQMLTLEGEALQLRALAFNDIARATGKTFTLKELAPVLESTQAAIEEAQVSYQGQTSRDRFTAERMARDYRIKVQMLMDQTGWSRAASQIAVKEREGFTLRDRIGRTWDSTRHAYLTCRSLYLDAYNTAALFALSLAGETTARVVHTSPDHAHHGLEFRITEQAGDPKLHTYDEIRMSVFHPAGNALIAKR